MKFPTIIGVHPSELSTHYTNDSARLSLRRQFEPFCHPLLEPLIWIVHLARSIELSDPIGAIPDYDLLRIVCVVHSLVWVRYADV